MKTLVRWMFRGFLTILSGILWFVSLPKVRNAIWDNTVGKGRAKVIDAKARVVASGKKAGGDKKNGGLFG